MSTTVSAPGKVLLAGGYLVLDRAYTGLVFGLSARIHVVVRDLDTTASEIRVESPQFIDAAWDYGYRPTEQQAGVGVTQLQGSTATTSRNPFVETALLYALTYISAVLPPSTPLKPTKITIFADNDYYSHSPSSSSPAPTSSTQKSFSNFGVRLQDAHKTGLGSSAALVTAFTGAVLSHYLPPSAFSLSTSSGRSVLHNLSQAAHCAAQGKIGSGFDVAAAVYGTCVYRRFSPSILSTLGEPGSSGFGTRVKEIVEDVSSAVKWDTTISKDGVSIPTGTALIMCDVDCGSQTVSMVKKVLEWRAKAPVESKALWDELQAYNVELGAALASSSTTSLPAAFSAIRERIRTMGKESGVPIEPEEQTRLLDAVTAGVDGVVGGVVPGAGGYDAIVLLVKDDEQTLRSLDVFLKKWKEDGKGNVKLLGARGELEGARLEDGKAYAD